MTKIYPRLATEIGFYHLKVIVTITCGTSVTFHAKDRNALFLIFILFFGGGSSNLKGDKRVTKVVTIRLEREREGESKRERERKCVKQRSAVVILRF